MSPAAMQETLQALKNARNHMDFQITARRDLGKRKGIEQYETRVSYIQEAIREVKQKLEGMPNAV